MKREDYIPNGEMKEFIILSGTLEGVGVLIEKTKDKDWLKKLRTAFTYLDKVLKERIDCVKDNRRKLMAKRKMQECTIHWTSKDRTFCVADPDEEEKVTAPLAEFYHICEVAATDHCVGCEVAATEYKKCPLREWLIKCDCPAMVGNPGEMCEYWVDKKSARGEA